jgi:hypothetical protein
MLRDALTTSHGSLPSWGKASLLLHFSYAAANKRCARHGACKASVWLIVCPPISESPTNAAILTFQRPLRRR